MNTTRCLHLDTFFTEGSFFLSFSFLVLDESGHKLGKSSGAPVWLCPSKTSPFEFYQYFYRIPDDQAEKMLNLFSFLPESEIQV